MDELDRAILTFLQKDGRMRFTEIAKELGVSEGTVRNRVARLQAEHGLQIVGMIDPRQIGYDAPAIIGVAVQSPYLESAAAEIATWPEVSYLIMVSGEYDLMVEVMCRDREHLSEFLRERLQKVPGVQRTQTFMILHTYKMASGARPVLTKEVEKSPEDGKV
ncbi:MAG: Lrp/AsnC family transcriptional regulator [Chloroflexi bacterium]|nr:MAG: Lrp/AsnC family transcriptional regulator [Chloroflexota bacterium]